MFVYKTLICPLLTYGSETWTISRKSELSLLVHERKILRSIFRPICMGGGWRKRTNQELNALLNKPDIVKVIKLGRLRWAGHMIRMGENEIPRKALTEQVYGTRRVGRPKLHWGDGVNYDAHHILGTWNCRAAALDQEWRLLKKALIQ